MRRRTIFGFALAIATLLALAAPALAGGWAVITLDSLPKEVRAGQQLRVGFVIRQHGRDPVNTDWEGRPLKPILTARKQADAVSDGNLVLVAAQRSSQNQGAGESIRAEARQEGAVGHFVADVVFPSTGAWEWEIAAPPFTIQGNEQGDAAVFAPLAVLPASATSGQAPAPAAAIQLADQTPATVLGLSTVALRWAGVILLVVAAGVALTAQRRSARRHRSARSQ